MKTVLLVISLLIITTISVAEEGKITIPIAQQGDTAVMRPARGMLKTEVEKKFGMPTQVVGPIGTPPITRWIYENYTVIFEHEHVVHTVLKMKVPVSELPVDYPADATPPVQ